MRPIVTAGAARLAAVVSAPFATTEELARAGNEPRRAVAGAASLRDGAYRRAIRRRVVAWDLAPHVDRPAAHVERMDVSAPDSVEAAVRSTLAAQGRIDVLVNSAGVNDPTVSSREQPIEDWWRVVAVDLAGGSRAADPSSRTSAEEACPR